MENLALQNKSNFFETRVSEYAKANSTATSQQLKLQILDDF
jgi:ribonucleotide reductase beta subunit family protein with ferritin-like domain